MSTAHAVEPEFYFCPFCGFRDPLLYAIHFHIESFHTPDSPFVVAEEKAKDIEITEEEHSYVLCPEEACQEPVLRQELQTHLDMHLAERVALTESVDETLSANSQAAIAIGSSCTNPPKGSSDVVASSSGSSKSKSKSSSKSSHLHLHRSSSLKSDRKYHSKGADDNRFLVLARSKKTKKLGSPELGPYAMEKQMPPELYYELLRGPSISYRIEIGPGNKLIRVATVANETPNLVPILARLSERDHLVARAWLCDPGVRHVGKQLPREGGFCGYRNIQMMISYIQATFPEGTHPFPGMVPSIIKLQDYIEKGWDMGINVHGRVETGGIKNTRKYIGTSEAETVFVSMGIPCGVKHLSRTPDREACEILFDFVQWFYERGRPAGNTDRILRTHKPPIYFQHAGLFLIC
ncbi:peptidase family C78-domain-containing protein [Kalaharituber pfeilii]|nr:peptidase family C78-domain-containing protein [Kalaharituber pfeilii]